MRCQWIASIFLLAAVAAVAQEPKRPPLTPEEAQAAAKEVEKLSADGIDLFQRGRPAEAAAKLRRTLAIMRTLYPAAQFPDGHHNLALGLNNLGAALQAAGRWEEALSCYRENLEMRRNLKSTSENPDNRPALAVSLNNVGHLLHNMGYAEKAIGYYQESLDICHKLYPASEHPNGHPDLALVLNNLGVVLSATGQAEKALPQFEKSLDMRRRLYLAAQHPDVAQSLNNLAHALQVTGQTEKALPLYQQSLAMYRTLYPAGRYPDGHPRLANTLNNLGKVLRRVGETERALSCQRESLDIRRKLYPASRYPDGHAELAGSLHGMGLLLASAGRAEEALTLCRQSLDMDRRLYPAAKYPDGHPDLADSIGSLGDLLLRAGRAEEALPLIREGLGMKQSLLRRELLTASEEAAFDRVAAERLGRDAYLSVTRLLNVPADSSYAAIWPARSLVSRLLEQRQGNARAAGSEYREKLDELRGNRRRTEQLLQDKRLAVEERDRLLANYADKRDKLERELTAAIPALKRGQELDKLGPGDLVGLLPPGAAFVDVIRYVRREVVDSKEKHKAGYVAFVLAKDRAIQRVELEDAGPIDAAVRQWRTAIETRHAAADVAGDLARRVWGPIAKALPHGTNTVYLAADGNLARLPWAALPLPSSPGSGGEGAGVRAARVLLEEYALAQVPHGPYLLDQLKFGRPHTGSESLLALGGVDYGLGSWPVLPGTAVEVEALATLAPGTATRLSKLDATAARVQELLPRVRYAHLATHGEFKADELTREKQRAAAALESRSLGDDSRKVAAKNPLGYVGLVLAGGEIMSGLSIVDLPLEKLKLVTLSACETGLGESTGGEGVQGLQRAFHLAGCPNVVASLWKVNDAATAALMAKFYHEMWVNKKPPIEALREAQLTIYRHPELIPDLAGERGAVRVKEAVGVKPGEPSGVSRRVSDTKLWAAFVLSGVGK